MQKQMLVKKKHLEVNSASTSFKFFLKELNIVNIRKDQYENFDFVCLSIVFVVNDRKYLNCKGCFQRLQCPILC